MGIGKTPSMIGGAAYSIFLLLVGAAYSGKIQKTWEAVGKVYNHVVGERAKIEVGDLDSDGLRTEIDLRRSLGSTGRQIAKGLGYVASNVTERARQSADKSR